MDFHYNKLERADGRLDFHRFVLLVTHGFSDRIRFVGELELEHAFVEGLEEAGELELEQAYVDFLLSRGFNVRAGMLLMPVGIINERHEPPVYYGVERTFVDTVIVPTTWFEVGAGIHGEVGHGWRYRAFVTSPLNAAEFSEGSTVEVELGGRLLLRHHRLLVRRRLVLLTLDQVDAVVDQVRVEVLDLLFGEIDVLEAGDDLVVGQKPLLLPFLDELLDLFDVRQRDVDREH